MTEPQLVRKKVATMITPDLHKAFGILLQLDDVTMDEFLRKAIEDYVAGHMHANAVAHILKEPGNQAAAEAVAKLPRRRRV